MHSGHVIWFHILLSSSFLIHFAIHSEQTEGSCRQETDIHAGGVIVAQKSSVHIMQLLGPVLEATFLSLPLLAPAVLVRGFFDAP
jgi:hypothetical protein